MVWTGGHFTDNTMHCCFYSISPFEHELKSLEDKFMKIIHIKLYYYTCNWETDKFHSEEMTEVEDSW